MMILFALTVWAVLASAATLLMCALGRAGRLEDEARGYVPMDLPLARRALDDLVLADS